MPAKRVRVKRRQTQAEAMFGELDKELLTAVAPSGTTTVTPMALQKSLKAIAPLLWSSSFVELLAAEWQELSALGLSQGASLLKEMAPVSTYRARHLERNPEANAERGQQQSHDMAARALRQGNQQMHVFSICARSIAVLAHCMPMKDWMELLLERAVLSRTTTTKLVRIMMACRPKAPFRAMKGISFHIFDQTDAKKGKARGTHRAAERVDASGALVDLVNMIIVNSMHHHSVA